jgi:hypothetical protein
VRTSSYAKAIKKGLLTERYPETLSKYLTSGDLLGVISIEGKNISVAITPADIQKKVAWLDALFAADYRLLGDIKN